MFWIGLFTGGFLGFLGMALLSGGAHEELRREVVWLRKSRDLWQDEALDNERTILNLLKFLGAKPTCAVLELVKR